MIRRTLARLTVSLAALTLVACQDTESPLAPTPRFSAPRLSIDPNAQLDQQNLESNTGVASQNSTFGQSFTAGVSGQLTAISVQVNCARFNMPDGVVEVYEGKYDFYNTDAIGFSPTPIASQPVPASTWPACSNPPTVTWIDVAFDTPASIVAGQAYTFRFKSPNAGAQVLYPVSDANPYTDGWAFTHSIFDIVFKTFVLPPTPQLDQQNLESNISPSTSNNAFGQSFTAGLSGQLTTISMLIQCARFNMPDAVLEVYDGAYNANNTIGFSPTPIASQPISASVWPACPTSATTWLDIAFDTPASIVAEQVYTFRIKSPSTEAQIWHPASDANPYAGGSAFAHHSLENVFKTYVLAGSDPTPSDVTPPVITPVVTGTLGNTGWYTSDVTVTWTVTDAESAVTAASPGCASTTVSSDNAGVTFTCSALSAGGEASQSVTVKRDATAPMLNSSVSPKPVLLNGSATASHGASDEGSGIASASCAAVATSAVGTNTVACTATDNAGNVSNQTASYSVFYPFTGFLGGVSAPPTLNSTKAGTSVQLRFSLGGNRGLAILAAGSPTAQSIACTGKPIALDEPVTVGGSGLTYEPKNGQYSFTWKTEKGWAGTCRKLSVKLIDGSEHTAHFQLTK